MSKKSNTAKIPSKAHWGKIDKNDLDANWAYKQFFGKSFSEAERMFQENALYYQEDLQSMPEIPFNFYVQALEKYIVSERAKDDSDGASSFLAMVAWMLKTQQGIISKENRNKLISASAYITNNQSFYDADIDIYGKFEDRLKEINNYSKL